jgi:hypothetical protein
MNRDGRSSSNDPAAEPTVDQTTPSASGLSKERPGPGVERNRALDDDMNQIDLETPRRYEQPIADDDDPVMPSDDATVNTKI